MAENNWVIDVENLVRKIQGARSAAEVHRWKQQSIYKLPACVRNLDENAYTPQVVSFGPYHCNNENLKPMEEHKDRALVQFLIRSGKSLQSYLSLLNDVVNDLQNAYDSLQLDLHADSNAFLRIMIRDGCFMLEILRAFKEDIGYGPDDPIFSDHGRLYVMPHMKRDMLMLENQLPMLVLHKLLSLQEKKDVVDLNQLLSEFFHLGSFKVPPDCLHILDMCRRSRLRSPEKKQQKAMMPIFGNDIMRSAVELHEAGITFKKTDSSYITDIKFERGVLSLPMIVVDDITKPLYLNLMAFERFHVGAGNEVTAYVYFMDNIIDDAPDISLLHSKDIIQNGVGSDKAAAKLFNSLSKDITLDENSELGEVYKKVNDYCKKPCHRYRANLFHRYLTTPWATISVLAAAFLFALTITQTVYSVIGYYNQK